MSTKLSIVDAFENSTKKPIVFLALIGFAGLFLRLVYFPYDVPLFNDAQGYFWYAIDMSILNQLPSGHSIVNNGWPSFLSIIFQTMDSNYFLDYHNMQRFVGTVFSVATIFPVYFLCSMYFKKSYSLLGAALFVFEPRLIQNSFAGTPESMYVFLMALLLFLFLSNNFKKVYLAFGILALLALVRYEGLLMIIPISIVFFIRFRKQKRDLIKYIICISIFILILVPVAYFKTETMGPGIDTFSHISAGPEYYQASIQNNSSTLADFLYLGSINLIKFLGWALIPSFIIFVPLGIIFIFKSLDYKKIIIILSILIMLIPAFYGYSRGFQEMKYLYVLYNEHYREVYEILTEIGQKEMKINKEFGRYGPEFTYLSWITLHNVDEFPVLKKELPPKKISTTSQPNATPVWNEQTKQWDLVYIGTEESEEYHNPLIDNLIDYFQVLKKQKITHLISDENNMSQLINNELRLHLTDIFNHENKYPFLVKEYDSKENGFNYHVKLFKIDYNLYDEWVNEN